MKSTGIRLKLFFLLFFPVIITTCGGGESSGCGSGPSPNPSPPTLTAKAVSETQIELTWTPSHDPNDDLAGYHIFRNGSYLATVTLAYLHNRNYTDSGLSVHVEYCYSIEAYDKQGNTSLSSTACAITDVTAPSVPGSEQAVPASSGSMLFSWSPATDNDAVEGYKIYRDGAYLASSASTAFPDSNLAASTQYCYAVSAYDFAGNESSRSPDVCARTLSVAISALDAGGNVGRYTSLALDGGGTVHISYYDATNQALKYATNKTGEWVVTTVDSSVMNYNMASQYTSIAVDASGFVHVSYADGDLKYATNASGSWAVSVVDNSPDVSGWYSSLAVDSSGKVHISYYDNGNGDLVYATNAAGSWETTTLDAAGNVGEFTSLALDSANRVHISYYDGTNGRLKYISNASGIWASSVIDSGWLSGQYSSLAIDSQDHVHISYYSNMNWYPVLRYATNATGSWETMTVDNAGNVGFYTSLALDTIDQPHVSYYDLSSGDLKYAVRVAGFWVATALDRTGIVGKYTSLAIQAPGKVHISYYDETNGDLKYAVIQ